MIFLSLKKFRLNTQMLKTLYNNKKFFLERPMYQMLSKMVWDTQKVYMFFYKHNVYKGTEAQISKKLSISKHI